MATMKPRGWSLKLIPTKVSPNRIRTISRMNLKSLEPWTNTNETFTGNADSPIIEKAPALYGMAKYRREDVMKKISGFLMLILALLLVATSGSAADLEFANVQELRLVEPSEAKFIAWEEVAVPKSREIDAGILAGRSLPAEPVVLITENAVVTAADSPAMGATIISATIGTKYSIFSGFPWEVAGYSGDI
jgi:hypothetical protein